MSPFATPRRKTARSVSTSSARSTVGPVLDSWSATFDALIERERGAIYVAEDDELGVLGVASVSFNLAIRFGGEYCQLEELYVDPKARGKNCGGLLVQAVIDGRKSAAAPMSAFISRTGMRRTARSTKSMASRMSASKCGKSYKSIGRLSRIHLNRNLRQVDRHSRCRNMHRAVAASSVPTVP